VNAGGGAAPGGKWTLNSTLNELDDSMNPKSLNY